MFKPFFFSDLPGAVSPPIHLNLLAVSCCSMGEQHQSNTFKSQSYWHLLVYLTLWIFNTLTAKRKEKKKKRPARIRSKMLCPCFFYTWCKSSKISDKSDKNIEHQLFFNISTLSVWERKSKKVMSVRTREGLVVLKYTKHSFKSLLNLNTEQFITTKILLTTTAYRPHCNVCIITGAIAKPFSGAHRYKFCKINHYSDSMWSPLIYGLCV